MRRLLRWHVPAVTLAALALTLLAPQNGVAQSANTGKWISVVLPAEPEFIDPCYSSRGTVGRVNKYNVVEPLIAKDPTNNTLKPRLATSWERIDADNWRIKLREGVVFHDGTPFNSAAAKASIDRNWSKPLSCGDRSKYFSDVALDVSTPDAHTLQIKTSLPDSILPMRLSGLMIGAPSLSVEKVLPAGAGPVGTGPFVYESWQAGQQIVFKRNDKYWGPKPQAEGVRYTWRNESAVRASMVAIGEADIAHTISALDATDPKMDFSYLNSETTFLRLDMEKAPMTDRRVRLAMNLALDIGAMPGTLLPKAVIRSTQMVFPSIPGHNHELDKRAYRYDPAKAKQLLSEAKADGVPVETEMLFVSNPASFPNAAEVAEAFVVMWKAVGLNVKLLVVESGQYQEFQQKPYKENRQPTLLQSSHDNNNGDPVFSVRSKYGCDGATSTYCNPDFDKDVARVTGLGGADRAKGWEEVFRYLYEEAVPSVMLYHMVGFTRVNPRIGYIPDASTNGEMHIEDVTFK